MLLERKPTFLVALFLAIFVFSDSLQASSCSRSHEDCLWCQELPQQRLYLDGIENKEPEHLFLNGSFNLYGCLRSSSVCLAAVYHKSVASQGKFNSYCIYYVMRVRSRLRIVFLVCPPTPTARLPYSLCH